MPTLFQGSGIPAMCHPTRLNIMVCVRPLSLCLTAFPLPPFCYLTGAPLFGNARQK